MINIVIVEDDKRFSDVLKRTLNATPNFCVQAQYINGQEVLTHLNDQKLDIILLDINLPDMSGIELLKQLKPNFPSLKFIMCTSYDDDVRIFESLKYGADGYIIKSDVDDKLIQAIQDVYEGGSMMSSSIARKVMHYFLKEAETEGQKIDVLTKQENKVLDYLSQGLLYKEIADSTHSTINTIKKHCSSIYKKLEVSNRTEAINIFLKR